MQAGTLREGGRLLVLAMDDGSGHGRVPVWGTHSNYTQWQQSNWGSHPVTVVRKLWGESAIHKQALEVNGDTQCERTHTWA